MKVENKKKLYIFLSILCGLGQLYLSIFCFLKLGGDGDYSFGAGIAWIINFVIMFLYLEIVLEKIKNMSHYNFALAEKAQEHIKAMAGTFDTDIEYAVGKSYSSTLKEMYTPSNKESLEETLSKISVVDMTTENAVHKFAGYFADGKTAILNFASYKYPGGGFIKGSKAQEEMLCHASTLYNVISSDKFADEYKEHRSNTNNSLYYDWLIYSPYIIFPYRTTSEDDEYVNVVTCAAPNIKAYKENGGQMTTQEYRLILNKRIYHILKTMSDEGNEQVILGAFGCGVFGNDPTIVAETFKCLFKHFDFGFKKIIFAIPAGPNLEAFKKIFNKD